MNSLSHTLIGISLATNDPEWATNTRNQLSSATELEWKRTIETLALHRLLPLVFYSLRVHNLTDAVPSLYLAQIQAAYFQTRLKNTVLLLTLDGILKVMGERGLHPVLWKGVVLADSFYPELGTRPMEDIDFALPPDEMDEATAVFQSLGLLPLPDAETSDAVYFANHMGVACDVHHRVRLFEGFESMNLTTKLKPRCLKADALPVLEPNAMVVHLIVHMDGHRSETGLLLSWIVDLVFVLRKWGTLLQLEQIERLMPAKEHLVSLFRIISFLEKEFEEKPPDCLANAARKFEPFTLAEILRQRRLALWGLPRFNGWLRLVVSRLGFRLRYSRPELYISDLFLGFADALRNLRIGNQLIPKISDHVVVASSRNS